MSCSPSYYEGIERTAIRARPSGLDRRKSRAGRRAGRVLRRPESSPSPRGADPRSDRHARRPVEGRPADGPEAIRTIRSPLMGGSEHRRLRPPGRDRAGRRGDRLPGAAAEPQSSGRRQGAARRCIRDAGRRASLPQRGRDGGQPRPPQHRPDLRGRRGRRLLFLQHAADRGGEPGGPRRRVRRRHPPGRQADVDGGPRDRSCSRAGYPPPRPQAVEHPDRRPRRAPGGRLRPGPSPGRRQRSDPDRDGPGHALIHGAGAGRRADRRP